MKSSTRTRQVRTVVVLGILFVTTVVGINKWRAVNDDWVYICSINTRYSTGNGHDVPSTSPTDLMTDPLKSLVKEGGGNWGSYEIYAQRHQSKTALSLVKQFVTSHGYTYSVEDYFRGKTLGSHRSREPLNLLSFLNPNFVASSLRSRRWARPDVTLSDVRTRENPPINQYRPLAEGHPFTLRRTSLVVFSVFAR